MENKVGTSFDELLFSELRLVSFKQSDSEIDENSLVKAMTVNEELINIGYSLSPKDIILLSKSKSLDGFFNHVKSLVGEVKALPMYPNFPTQVMELTEAQFRFHQILHYMSTYGMELIMGTPVEKGWTPYPDAPQKTEKDTRLLEAKTIGLVSESEKYITAISKVTNKRERLTDKELLIVKSAVGECSTEQLAGLTVPFKQNLLAIFYCIFDSENESTKKISALRAICQHSGDAWKCIDYTITRKHYHLRTSEKKVLVKLLESFSARDFRENLIISNKKAERIKVLLPFISYDNLSRSAEHKSAVDDLRNGRLHSWVGTGTALIEQDADKAIDYFAKRPGELLRRMNHLLKRGCSEEKLENTLIANAESLSIQTLVTNLNTFGELLNKYKNFDYDAEYSEKTVRFDDTFEYEDDYTAEEFNIYRNQIKSEIESTNELNRKNRAEFEAKKAEITELLDRTNILFDICEAVLAERLKYVTTGMEGKKVYIDFHNYDERMSVVNCNNKSDEGGYIRSGLAIKLPDNIDRMRFFVYWNHPTRVDLDLHASAMDLSGNRINIGWNSDFRTKNASIIFSGDMTHSDAAEYVDFELNRNIKTISANINIYYGVPTFKELEEVFVGIMAVDKLGQDVKLYSSENCFFTHYLTGNYRTINYGYIDVENRVLIFDGREETPYNYYGTVNHDIPMFSLGDYLNLLIDAKEIEVVEKREDAEIVLVMEKPSKKNELSIIDNNFFMN
ncbi:MAG: hypothetical protein K2K91_09475 [Ruminococcus sp.]|nr:hypothetical protein [Ruminococcus sp.]